VEYVHAVLRKAFRDAVVVDQLLPSNPVDRAKRPRKPVHERGQIWTAGQLRLFLDVARAHRLFAFYHLAAYTGARRGELLNLRWRDIDLASAEVHISGSAAVIGGTRIEGTTKSGRSRTVSIDGGTVQLLREHRTRQEEERLTAGPHWTGSDQYVFTTGLGSPIHPDTVSSLMADLIKANNVIMRAGRTGELLPRARLHDLRHLHVTTPAASWCARPRRGGSPGPRRSVSHAAGLRHVNRDQVAEAADIFARSIPSGKKAGVSKSVSKKAVSKQPRTR
jgi:integrase